MIYWFSVRNHLNTLWTYRQLLVILTERELKVRYKQTFLGVLWAIIQPLSLMVLLTLVFRYFTSVNSDGIPYPLFSYTALLPWTFFQTAVQFGSMSTVNNSGLVSKIWFPREILPLSSLLAALADFGIASTILIGFLWFYNVPPTIHVLWIFLLIPVQLIMTAGITLWFNALVVLFRDLKFVIPLLLQTLFYATPIIYSINSVPDRFMKLVLVNPLTGIIDSYRRVFLLGESPHLVHLGTSVVIGFILLWTGYWFQKRVDRRFADIM